MEKKLNNNNQDIHIDLIVYNKIHYGYVDKTNNDFFKRDMEKIGRDIPKYYVPPKKVNYFFTGPSLLFDYFIYELKTWNVSYYNRSWLDGVYDRSRNDLINYYSLIHEFCKFDSLYETKNGKYEICLFYQLMDGYSKFFYGFKKYSKKLPI